MPVPVTTLRTLFATCVITALPFAVAAPVLAQTDEPPGPFVIDARGAFASLSPSEALALPRGLQTSELPGSVLGLDIGGHLYPVRGKITLGLGAAFIRLSGTQTPEPLDDTSAADAPVTAGTFRLTGIAPQLSLNFGSSRGWSYIGAGLGLSTLVVGRADAALDGSPQLLTLNMGGGARWFISEHAAFNFDLRFYRVGAKELSADYLGNPTVSLFVIAVGVSFK